MQKCGPEPLFRKHQLCQGASSGATGKGVGAVKPVCGDDIGEVGKVNDAVVIGVG
jgi:methenyltetrahydromethanopterin cyclohydrolase